MLTLDEIAKQLGTSKTNLKRALSIERNLTEPMKQLLDGRRNLPPAQRLAVMDKFKKKIQEQAKERQSEAGREFGNGKNSSTPIGVNLLDNKNERKSSWTDSQTAKKAGVGVGTVARYNRVMNSDDEELKRKVLADEMSINAGIIV